MSKFCDEIDVMDFAHNDALNNMKSKFEVLRNRVEEICGLLEDLLRS